MLKEKNWFMVFSIFKEICLFCNDMIDKVFFVRLKIIWVFVFFVMNK